MTDMMAPVLARIATDATLWSDFATICGLGGRVAGAATERAAVAWLGAQLAAMPGANRRDHEFGYGGCQAGSCRLERTGPGPVVTLPANPLIRSIATPPQGLEAEVLDLGRGTLETFDALARDIRGRFALARHEYMFADGHLHRRRKYNWALERGAAGFLIASCYPCIGPVAGSTGRDDGPGIPGVGITVARPASNGGAIGGNRISRTAEIAQRIAEIVVRLRKSTIGIDGGAERRFCSGGIAANAMDQSEIVMAAGVAGRRAQNAAIKCLCIVEFAAAMGQNGLLPQRFDAAARTEPSRRCPLPLPTFFLHGHILLHPAGQFGGKKTKL